MQQGVAAHATLGKRLVGLRWSFEFGVLSHTPSFRARLSAKVVELLADVPCLRRGNAPIGMGAEQDRGPDSQDYYRFA